MSTRRRKDAAGDGAHAERKRALRRAVWEALREAHVARFPGARGRIPNFTGAEAAAEHLAAWPVWQRARVLKCNPDLAQRPVRLAALRAGKVVYVAVPRLRDELPFLELDPAALDPRDLWAASSIRGAADRGRPVGVDELRKIDLVVCGSVAVDATGARLGKGGGYSDLEYGLLRAAGVLTARTPVVTTVHPLQVRRRGQIPMLAHDVSLDGFALPDRMRTCDRTHRRPAGVLPDALDDEKRAAIPCLAHVEARATGRTPSRSKARSTRTSGTTRTGRASRTSGSGGTSRTSRATRSSGSSGSSGASGARGSSGASGSGRSRGGRARRGGAP